MDNKQIELSNKKINDIKDELSLLLNKIVTINEMIGTSKKVPKYTTHIGKLVSISKNLFNIEQTIGTYKIIKSFQLNDILIGRINVDIEK